MRRARIYIATIVVTYVIFEAAFYVALCFGLAAPGHPYYTFAAWSNPRFVIADHVLGYRLRPHASNSGIQSIRGDVQFYSREIRVNGAGFHSNREYFAKKQRPYRLAVYGDSFTAMLYDPRPWPDYLNELYEAKGIEVLNFSLGGIGLANWHAHYTHELVAKYDFDMVLFAVCCGDLLRGFTVAETRPDGQYINRFARPPADPEDLDRNYRPHLVRLVSMLDRQALGRIHDHLAHHSFLALPPAPYFFRLVRRALLGSNAPVMRSAAVDSTTRRDVLGGILRDLRKRGKIGVLVALPWNRTLVPDADVEEVRAIAKRECSPFINGYDLFRAAGVDTSAYWPTYDGHWLGAGADRFAELLAGPLLEVRDDIVRRHGTSGCND